MAGNVAMDTVFGSVPLVGDIFDAAFKSNRRNVALLRRHLDRTKTPGCPAATMPSPRAAPQRSETARPGSILFGWPRRFAPRG
jgi:hypothetical protein